MEKKPFDKDVFDAGKALKSDEMYNKNVQLGYVYHATVLPTEEEDYPYRVALDTGERAIITSDRKTLSGFDKVDVRVYYINRERHLIEVKIIE